MVGATLILVALRIAAFRFEWLYGQAQERNANLLIAAAILLAGVALASAYRQASSGSSERGAAILLVGGALAAGVAAIGAVQLVLPATPYKAAAPACAGVPLLGARFLAQTSPGGVNARSGPGTDYPQVNRFPGGCTLGFDGFCVGLPVPDEKSDLTDARWLLVHDRDYMISSAKLLDQSPLEKLGSVDKVRCKRLGGAPSPSTPEFTATIASPTQAKLKSDAAGTSLIGYAVRVMESTDGYEYSSIKVKTRATGFDGIWQADTDAKALPAQTGHVELAAASCLAADAPSGRPTVYLARFERGILTSLERSKPTSELDSLRLRTIACAGAP